MGVDTYLYTNVREEKGYVHAGRWWIYEQDFTAGVIYTKKNFVALLNRLLLTLDRIEDIQNEEQRAAVIRLIEHTIENAGDFNMFLTDQYYLHEDEIAVIFAGVKL